MVGYNPALQLLGTSNYLDAHRMDEVKGKNDGSRAQENREAKLKKTLVVDTPKLLFSYRSAPDWQPIIQRKMAVFLDFLFEHRLILPNLLDNQEERSGLYILYREDLTEEGQRLVRAPISALDKWLIANSNPAKPLSMRSLENGLKKVRSPN